MAKRKNNGTFDFVGVLQETIMSEDNKRMTVVLRDNEIESEVRMNIWNNAEASYLDFGSGNPQRVEGTKESIESKMKEIRANGTGIPFGITLKTPKSTEMYYVNEELIEKLSKLTKLNKKYTVRCKGTIDFRTYNNRVMKNYNIRDIEVLQGKVKQGFHVTFPIVFSELEKEKFVYRSGLSTVVGLVKAKLENGQWGHRPIKIGLDKDYLLGGMVEKIAKQNKIDILDLINNKVIKVITEPMQEIKGYVEILVSGRLKVGEIVKKPTIDDLTPLERSLVEFMDKEYLQNKLNSMEEVKEYFDSVILESIGLGDGQLVREVYESELNLIKEEDTVETYSNPMADVLANLADAEPTEGDEKVPTKESEDLGDDNENTLESLVSEKDVFENSQVEEEFPF